MFVGVMYFNRDPSWRPWEYRVGYIFDNYLFECVVENEGASSRHRIIGYAQLCEAQIVSDVVRDEDLPSRGNKTHRTLQLLFSNGLIIRAFFLQNKLFHLESSNRLH